MIQWLKDGGNPQGVFPDTFAVRMAPWAANNCLNCIGRNGFYSMDLTAVLVKGTYKAAYDACQTALTGAEALLAGEPAVFSLCRPPGHHATQDIAGGYCFFNNAAVATQYIKDKNKKVAILDIDFHHGNGTQSIFYDQSNPLYVSLHGDPLMEYPYYW